MLEQLLASAKPGNAEPIRHVVVNAKGDITMAVMVDPTLPASSQWQPPPGHTLHRCEHSGDGEVGWRWDRKKRRGIDPNPLDVTPDAD